MRKIVKKNVTLFALLLMVSQLFFPFGNALANGSMLPPSNLSSQNATPDDVKLTWSPVFGATGYNVYEITDGQLILRDTVKTTSYNLNNLAEGSYRFVVSTLSSDGESGPSAPISFDITYPEMAAPQTLTQTIKNGNDIVLSWGTSEYTETYHIYQIDEDGQKTLLTSTKSRTHTVVNAAEGSYKFAVSAENSLYGESSLSEIAQADVILPVMTTPSNFRYSITNGNDITLNWDSVPYSTSYKLYQITETGKELKSTLTGTSTKLTNVAAGNYKFEIQSFSERFGESVGDEGQLFVTIDEIIMTAPTNLSYKLQNINDIILTWDSVPFAKSYKVYRIINGEKTIVSSNVTGTSVTYAKAEAGEHVYEVHSYSDRFGESAEGSEVSLVVENVQLEAPANVTYKVHNGNDIVLNWDSTSNTTNYKIYQITEDGNKVLKSTVSGNTVTYANLPEGDYRYAIYSNSTRFGESEKGTEISILIIHPEMTPPENLKEEINNDTSFTLSWDASEYVTSYKVYQIVDGKKVLKNNVPGTSITYTRMPSGDYSYEVYSYSSRFGESETGTQLSFTLEGQTMKAPTEPTFSISNGNDISLKWTASEYATSYKIYQVVDGEKELKRTVTTTGFTFGNMPEGEYNYVIHSYSPYFGESKYGAKLTFSLDHPTMEAPINITYKVQNGNDVVLNWESVEFANSYNIYELINGELVYKQKTSSLSITLSNVSAGEHTYAVYSVSSRFGESTIGSQITFDVVHPIMKSPETITYEIKNGNDIVFTYDNAEYANTYKIYELVDGEKVSKATTRYSTATLVNVSEGEHKYFIHSYSDRFGESQIGNEMIITIDFPVMQAPENITQSFVNGNDLVLKWNSSTFASNYYVYQIIDGEKVLQTTVKGTGITFTNLPEGDYTYEIHSYSSRFGESPESSKISTTVVHPIMQAPENVTNSVSNGNDIVLRWNRADYSTGYNVYQVIDGEKVFQKKVTGTSVTFVNMPEGDYEYVVHSYSDRFEESPEGSSVELTLIWPVVQPPQLTGEVFNANNITLTWPAAAWANKYRVYQITDGVRELIYEGTARSYKVYNLTEDIHSFEVTAYSTRFGESKPSNQITENIIYPIMQPPVASLKLLSDTSARISWDFVTYANGYNIYEMIDGEQILLAEKVNNLSYTINNLSYANHEYVVTSYSNSFGESAPSDVVLAKLIIDEEAPVTTIDAPTDWVNESVDVNLTATDNEVGVEKTFYSLNNGAFVEGTTFSIEEEGIHKVAYYSVDKVGNTEKVKITEVKIDKTKPTTISNVEDTWNNRDFQVELKASDNLSGVGKTFYSYDGLIFVEGTSFTVKDEAINDIYFYSIDKAGNKEEIQTVEVKVDKTAPVTTSDVQDAWSNQDVQVDLKATDNLSGVTDTFYSVNGFEYVEGTSLTVSEEGITEVSYYSVDKAGNVEEVQTVQVKIDKTAPVTISNVQDVWNSTDFQVDLTATDSLSGVAQTFYSVNGSEYVEGTSFNVSEEGITEVSFYTVDVAGNKEVVQTVQVKIDKTAPTISLDVAKEYALGTDLQLVYSAADNLSGIAHEQMTVNGQIVQNGENFNFNQPGQYVIEVEATDHAGWTTKITKTILVYIPATVEVLPKVMNGNKGDFTVHVSLPMGYSPTDFDLDEVTLNGVSALTSNKGYYQQAKKGQFKFERQDLYWVRGQMTMNFEGKLGDFVVKGQAEVKVIK